MPAPVSEEIGKSDGFVSHLHDNQEKRAGPASRDWVEEKEWLREGVKGFDNEEQLHRFGFARDLREDAVTCCACVCCK